MNRYYSLVARGKFFASLMPCTLEACYRKVVVTCGKKRKIAFFLNYVVPA